MAADKPDFPAAAAIGQPRKPYRSAKHFSFVRDTTLLHETHASTTRKKSSGNLFRTLFTGIALGILLTVVFRKTGVWAAIRRFLKNLLP